MCSCVKHILENLNEEWERPRPASSHSQSSDLYRSRSLTSYSPLTTEHKKICLRLRPLLEIELALTREIDLESQSPKSPQSPSGLPRELCVRADSGWRKAFTMRKSRSMDKIVDRQIGVASEDDIPTAVLVACRDDIIALWADPVVRRVLHQRKARIELMPGL